MQEEWRDVVGFEGYYVVSNLGRIMRVKRGKNGHPPGTIRKPSPNRNGYLQTTLSKDGVARTVRVHVVVAEAFIGARPPGREVNHKNGNKADNRVENLEWVTESENVKHTYRELGRVGTRGSRDGMAKLTEADIPVIRELLASGMSQRKIAQRYGVSSVTICFISTGECWSRV